MHYAFLLKKIFRVLLVHENLCLVLNVMHNMVVIISCYFKKFHCKNL